MRNQDFGYVTEIIRGRNPLLVIERLNEPGCNARKGSAAAGESLEQRPAEGWMQREWDQPSVWMSISISSTRKLAALLVAILSIKVLDQALIAGSRTTFLG